MMNAYIVQPWTFMWNTKKAKLYSNFIRSMGMENDRTPDNIKYLGSRLDYKELNDMMRELAG